VSAGHGTRWGYHQLRPSDARRLVRDAGVGPGDLVVDLGAGTGAVTGPLLAAGATVVAVELHPGRAAVLDQRFHGTACRVVVQDLTEWRRPGRPFRVVANPPFAVLATLLRLLTAPHSQLVRADIVVPDQVAARWARGAVALHGFAARRQRVLSPYAFQPPSSRPAAVLTLYRIQRPARHRSVRH
jgi:23S rRNA (adenine-N6)-dimethyltransferase